ncbi:MAG: ABC transporter substrate-binding protein, partial [Lachnospiraceae bacterium]|nr:ABC transporter substrate-binding protein [Lachnospiraceae bacterium]
MIRDCYKDASIKKTFNQIPPAMLAVFVCFMLCLAGCGAKRSENGVSDNGVTAGDTAVSADVSAEISKVISEDAGSVIIAGYDSEISGLNEVIADFNEYYPNVKVEYYDLTDDEASGGLMENSAAGDLVTDPDSEVSGNTADEYAAERKAASYRLALEKCLEEGASDLFISDKILYTESKVIRSDTVDLSETDIDKGAIDQYFASQYESGNVCFAIPFQANVSGLLVNETALEQYDLEIPTEYIELYNACSVLKDDGICALGGSSDMYADLLKDQLVAYLSENDSTTEAVISMGRAEENAGDYLAESFEMLKFLRKKRFFSDSRVAEHTDAESALKSFEAGEIVFMPTDCVTAASVLADDFQHSFVPMPLGSDGASVCLKSASALSLNAKSVNRQWAEVFLNFMTGKEELDKLADDAGCISVTKQFPDECFDKVSSNVIVCDDPGISSRVMSIYSEALKEV